MHISKTLESKLLTIDSNWATLVNVIKHHFQTGGRVSKFLSKKIFDATFNDCLLNDYGVHLRERIAYEPEVTPYTVCERIESIPVREDPEPSGTGFLSLSPVVFC